MQGDLEVSSFFYNKYQNFTNNGRLLKFARCNNIVQLCNLWGACTSLIIFLLKECDKCMVACPGQDFVISDRPNILLQWQQAFWRDSWSFYFIISSPLARKKRLESFCCSGAAVLCANLWGVELLMGHALNASHIFMVSDHAVMNNASCTTQHTVDISISYELCYTILVSDRTSGRCTNAWSPL